MKEESKNEKNRNIQNFKCRLSIFANLADYIVGIDARFCFFSKNDIYELYNGLISFAQFTALEYRLVNKSDDKLEQCLRNILGILREYIVGERLSEKDVLRENVNNLLNELSQNYGCKW